MRQDARPEIQAACAAHSPVAPARPWSATRRASASRPLTKYIQATRWAASARASNDKMGSAARNSASAPAPSSTLTSGSIASRSWSAAGSPSTGRVLPRRGALPSETVGRGQKIAGGSYVRAAAHRHALQLLGLRQFGRLFEQREDRPQLDLGRTLGGEQLGLGIRA